MQNYQIAHLTMHQVGLTFWARKISLHVTCLLMCAHIEGGDKRAHVYSLISTIVITDRYIVYFIHYGLLLVPVAEQVQGRFEWVFISTTSTVKPVLSCHSKID